jgi:hypothetical protein
MVNKHKYVEPPRAEPVHHRLARTAWPAYIKFWSFFKARISLY